jgi:hypothetical protein
LNKRILALIALNISVLLLMPLANAQETKTVTVWTDKSVYAPGDTGTLNIAFYNFRGRTLLIKSITIIYDGWQAYDPNSGWQGNQTIDIGRAYVNKEVYYNTTKFTVPTDGRANSTTVHIIVQISDPPDIGIIEDYGYISVYQTPKYVEQIVTLFTILVVLIIVCTVILAATIFLSARRPRVTWKQNGE